MQTYHQVLHIGAGLENLGKLLKEILACDVLGRQHERINIAPCTTVLWFISITWCSLTLGMNAKTVGAECEQLAAGIGCNGGVDVLLQR